MIKVDFSLHFKSLLLSKTRKEQESIIDFVNDLKKYGLDSFSRYAGKFADTSNNLSPEDISFLYVKENNLWHYHIGHPNYRQLHSKYQTSDWIVHFVWNKSLKEVKLVDYTPHHNDEGNFNIPAKNNLK